MSELTIKPTVTFSLNIKLSEPEARALHEIVAWSAADIIRAIEAKCGRLSSHEDVKSFVDTVRVQLGSQISRVDEAQKLLGLK